MPDKHETFTKKMRKKAAAPGFQIFPSKTKLHHQNRVAVAITKDEQRMHERNITNVHDECKEITTDLKVYRI